MYGNAQVTPFELPFCGRMSNGELGPDCECCGAYKWMLRAGILRRREAPDLHFYLHPYLHPNLQANLHPKLHPKLHPNLTLTSTLTCTLASTLTSTLPDRRLRPQGDGIFILPCGHPTNGQIQRCPHCEVYLNWKLADNAAMDQEAGHSLSLQFSLLFPKIHVIRMLLLFLAGLQHVQLMCFGIFRYLVYVP